MGKTMKDYFRDRIPMPPPGRRHPSEKDYSRTREKKVAVPDPEEDDD